MNIGEDRTLSAYAWSNTGQLILATLQNNIYAVDGFTGRVVACHTTEYTLTCLLVMPSYLVTVGLNHEIKYWEVDFSVCKKPLEPAVMHGDAVPMGSEETDPVYLGKKVCDASPTLIGFYRYLRRPYRYTGIPLRVYRYDRFFLFVTGILRASTKKYR